MIHGDAGNDLLDGGIDNDTIFGGTGNDTIIGGQGADSLSGGDDRDTFLGAHCRRHRRCDRWQRGGDDFDTLDLRGSGPLPGHLCTRPIPKTARSTSSTRDGNITGTLTFTNIENVIPCFTPGTLIATPRGEVPVESAEGRRQGHHPRQRHSGNPLDRRKRP